MPVPWCLFRGGLGGTASGGWGSRRGVRGKRIWSVENAWLISVPAGGRPWAPSLPICQLRMSARRPCSCSAASTGGYHPGLTGCCPTSNPKAPQLCPLPTPPGHPSSPSRHPHDAGCDQVGRCRQPPGLMPGGCTGGHIPASLRGRLAIGSAPPTRCGARPMPARRPAARTCRSGSPPRSSASARAGRCRSVRLRALGLASAPSRPAEGIRRTLPARPP